MLSVVAMSTSKERPIRVKKKLTTVDWTFLTSLTLPD